MANPIQARDLIDQNAIDSLNKLGDTLERVAKDIDLLKQSLQGAAQGLQVHINNTNIDAQALSEMQKKVESLKNAMDATNKLQDENTKALEANTNARQRNNSARQRQSKMYDDELQAVERLAQEYKVWADMMHQGHTISLQNQKDVELQNKSYNELYATYNAMKDALNKMTSAEREASDAGKYLTRNAKAIYDEMNKLQMQTGKFQMNVGNYKRAFDGLGYSITQVARELPSLAINANTFFLAISNNIPMVFDEYKKFQAQQEGLQQQMRELADAGQQQSEAFKQLASQVMTLGQKLKALVTSFGFWISLLPTLLVFLPKIVGWVKQLFKGIKDVGDSLTYWGERSSVLMNANKTISETRVELENILHVLKSVEPKTDEWYDAMKRVKEITGENFDILSATPEQIEEITKKFLDQQKQIAINQEVYKKVASSQVNAEIKRLALANVDNEDSFFGYLGISADSKEGKELAGYLKNVKDAYGGFLYQALGIGGERKVNRNYDKLEAKLNELFPTMEYKSEQALLAMTSPIQQGPGVEKTGKGKGKGKGKENDPILEEMNDRYWDMLKARAKMIEDWYEQAVEVENIGLEEQLEANEIAYDNQITALDNNLRNQLITKEEYNDKYAQYKKEHDAIELSLEKEHQDKLHALWVRKETIRIDAEIENTKVVLQEYSKRVRTKLDEENKNRHINENIAKLEKQLAELRVIDTKNIEEEEKKKQEAIEATTKAIEKQRNSLSWSKQIANTKSLGELLGTSGMLEGLAGGDKKGFLALMGLDLTGASDEQIDSLFEEWTKNAGEAMAKWKDITIDNLGQMLDAFTDFYDRKAEAAAEDTDRAFNELNLQKSLLEQGLANSVNTAWAEYNQKKEIQKKAEEDAKKAQQLQKIQDTASTVSNMMVATSNILKQFAPNPILAGTLIATMWGAFAASKAIALKESKYGDGGYEDIVGGSHASGHDVHLGIQNGKGRSMVVEGGEGIGIFTRDARRRYGSDTIADVVKAINNGTYETESKDRLRRNATIMIRPGATASVSLGKLESGVQELVNSSRHTTYIDGQGHLVVKNGNSTTTYIR